MRRRSFKKKKILTRGGGRTMIVRIEVVQCDRDVGFCLGSVL